MNTKDAVSASGRVSLREQLSKHLQCVTYSAAKVTKFAQSIFHAFIFCDKTSVEPLHSALGLAWLHKLSGIYSAYSWSLLRTVFFSILLLRNSSVHAPLCNPLHISKIADLRSPLVMLRQTSRSHTASLSSVKNSPAVTRKVYGEPGLSPRRLLRCS